MPSPFPGMDPYLEGYLWPDVHHELASAIKELLVPQIRPRYVARLNLYTVTDTAPEEDVGIMYPDVEVLRRKHKAEEPQQAYAGAGNDGPTPSSLTISAVFEAEVRIPVVEIRNTQDNQLITVIEILSPVNKRRPGIDPYREKRRRLIEAGVHLMEIDLLRRGERPFAHPYLPKSHYLVTLVRSGSGKTDVWAIDIRESLPVLPVPLKAPDKDALLDLRKALDLIYDKSDYGLSVNYEEAPPPPDFSEEEKRWMREEVLRIAS
jgi:hypothetical protein